MINYVCNFDYYIINFELVLKVYCEVGIKNIFLFFFGVDLSFVVVEVKYFLEYEVDVICLGYVKNRFER